MNREGWSWGWLRWCVPGLIAGLALRVWMAWAMPFAYMQHDSFRLVVTGAEWLTAADRDAFGENVPFLIPALYRLALAGPLPGLVTIQLVQHTLGLIQIALAGALVRLWLPRWKWWIVPVTLVFAIHPSFLWFEHTVMLETIYVFAVICLALAGTWLLQRPSLAAARACCAATAFVAFTRPEGKLFVAFGAVALAVTFWKNWRQLAAAAGMFAITLAGISYGTVSGECGVLLYSSVLHLSPEVSRHYPEVSPCVTKLRREAIEAATRGPAFVSRPQRRELDEVLTRYVQEHPGAGGEGSDDERMNRIAKALAYETCLSAPFSLPGLALDKFRDSSDDLAHGKFTESWLHDRQISRLHANWRYVQLLDRDLYGRNLATLDEVAALVKAEFPPARMNWFCELHEEWRDLYKARFRDRKYADRELHGLSLFYLLTIAGWIAAVMRPLPARRFHACWIAMLAGLWFIVMLTANERARFRMGFEPFLFLYPFVAFDGVVALVQQVRQRAGACCRAGTSPAE